MALRVGVGLFLSLVLFLAGTLIYGGSQQLRATQRALEEQESDRLLDTVELQLRNHHSLGNIVSASGAEGYVPLWVESEQRLRYFMRQLEGDVNSFQEQQLFKRLEQQVDRYLVEWREARRRELSIEEVIPRIRPFFEAPLVTLSNLKSINLHQTLVAREELASLRRSSTLIGVLGIVAVLGGMFWLLAAFHKQIFTPLQRLSDTVERFQEGDTSVCAPEKGVEEISRIARSFNILTASLNRYRKEQLAYLAGVAHDLRNPLTGLKLGLQILRREIAGLSFEGESRAQILDKKAGSLEAQIDRLNYMIDGLFDAVRIEAGQLELQRRELDLREIVREVVDFYAPTTDHRFLVSLPEEPVLVNADQTRMHQVIGNLVSNAIKYSLGREVIEVKLLVNQEATLLVRDYGLGITPEELREIFAPFHRAAATREKVSGTGLGLSVVKRIISAHGGRVEVESTPNVGSTFRITLPLLQKSEEQGS